MAEGAVKRLLVVVNESMPKRVLFEAIAKHAEAGPVTCTVVVPQTLPRKGLTIANETVVQAATNRLTVTLKELCKRGIEATGEILASDPFLAATDGARTYDPDAIVIYAAHTLHSGFWRQDTVGRVQAAAGVPVEHVYSDDPDTARAEAILAIATPGFSAAQLAQTLQYRMSGKHGWLAVVCPTDMDMKQERQVRAELQAAIEQLNVAGIDAVGQTMFCDTLVGIENAIQYYPAKEVFIAAGSSCGNASKRLLRKLERLTAVPIERLAPQPWKLPQ